MDTAAPMHSRAYKDARRVPVGGGFRHMNRSVGTKGRPLSAGVGEASPTTRVREFRIFDGAGRCSLCPDSIFPLDAWEAHAALHLADASAVVLIQRGTEAVVATSSFPDEKEPPLKLKPKGFKWPRGFAFKQWRPR